MGTKYDLLLLSVMEGITAVNRSLSQGSPGDTLQALRSLGDSISSVLDFAAPLYHEEMGAIREDAGVRILYPSHHHYSPLSLAFFPWVQIP